MARRISRRELARLGEIALLLYLLIVIVIAITRLLFGYPTIGALACSPALLSHGEWWRLFTSAFIIEGPAIPQLLAIAVLGSLGIYIGGSWLFWSSAVAAHILGTLVAYVGFAALWLANHASASRYLTSPDYGVSLIWCAALGVFTALAWLGQKPGWRKPEQPMAVALAITVMLLVVVFSDKMEAAQHFLAYVIGFGIMALADRTTVRKREPSLLTRLRRV